MIGEEIQEIFKIFNCLRIIFFLFFITENKTNNVTVSFKSYFARKAIMRAMPIVEHLNCFINCRFLNIRESNSMWIFNRFKTMHKFLKKRKFPWGIFCNEHINLIFIETVSRYKIKIQIKTIDRSEER